MTTNKRFKNVEENLEWGTVQYFTYHDEKITDKEIEKLVNHLLNQNEKLKTQLSQFAKVTREGVAKVQSLAKEKENLKDEVYEEIDNALTVLRDLYEDTPLKSQSKMNNLYNRLESLRDDLK